MGTDTHAQQPGDNVTSHKETVLREQPREDSDEQPVGAKQWTETPTPRPCTKE